MGLTSERLAEIAAIPDAEIDLSEVPEVTQATFEKGNWRRWTGRTGHRRSEEKADEP